ncbi:MmgE/PrpD family protein [Saccharopolyspora sp. K220]|uniref:MmgE/PrpD family protein n=1 Tax=Saccharopolyspora soli TaxID=2926618 RepID=UPI001F5AE261|nr:MmgE/PrpD family protein [Saccharopolyspora soli]MCI2416400.1 MmgE/PrpD family protein [Saccharopolyspora soli]
MDTKRIAELIDEAVARPLPEDVLAMARRTLLNVAGTAIGASGHAAVDAVVAGSRGAARIPGRRAEVAPVDAAIATGIAAHLDDFDDTHLATVIHPGAACLGALAALEPEVGTAPATDVLTAYAWGCELQLRLGVAVSPSHYDLGWHITGTCGAFGAAVTSALLLGLRGRRLASALFWGIGRGLGMREGFGTMTKPFHPGKAAANGMLAARLAAADGPAPGDTLEAFTARLAREYDEQQFVGELGERFELRHNTFKPYPCGIVTHPAIEAAEHLAAPLKAAGGADEVASVEVRCHPLVPELTGNPTPRDGLQARFSTVHGVAAGLLLGTVDLAAYEDDFVASAAATQLRAKVRLVPEPERVRAEAEVLVTTEDGNVLRQHVPTARGSLANPLTDADLHTKVHRLVEPVLPGGADAVVKAVAGDGPGYLTKFMKACTGEE